MTGPRKALSSAWTQTKAGFLSLRGSPRDLYLIFALKVLESYNYFSLSRSMTLFLTEEFGVDDYKAGTIYGLWGTLLTLYGFLLGGTIDYLGVKLSLLICFVLNIFSRFVMSTTTSTAVMLTMLLGPNTAAGALGVPVMTIGVKRHTNELNRGFGFSLFYSLMNIAALTQGMFMDVFRIGFKHGFQVAGWGEHSLINSGFRMFLASGCLTSLAGLCLTFCLSGSFRPGGGHAHSAAPAPAAQAGRQQGRQQAEHEGLGDSTNPSPEQPLLLEASGRSTPEGEGEGGSGAVRPGGRVASAEETLLDANPGSAAAEVSLGGTVVARRSSPAEHHSQQQQRRGGGGGGGSSSGGIEAELDRWAEGEPGQLDTPSKTKHLAAGGLAAAGSMLDSIKAVLASPGFWKYMVMCVFTVNLKSIFRHLDATLPKFQLRAFGCDTPIGLIYAINPAMIVLLVPVVGAMTTGFQHFDMIHLGGYISALSPFWMVAFDTEWSTAAFVAMLSLGEAIWSPRWYDYSMSVAPDGKEGIFTALASAPLFAAMLPTGMISGKLLATYCPDTGRCNSDSAGPTRRRSLLEAAAAAVGAGSGAGGAQLGDVTPAVAECEGRVLWLVVGAITLSSPLLILLTQRWIRPRAADFAKVQGLLPSHRAGTEGEHFDVNEADPTALVENVFQARSEQRELAGKGGEGEEGEEEGRALLASPRCRERVEQ